MAAVRIKVQHCAITYGSPRSLMARALRGVLTSARANRHVRRSLVAHVRRTEDTGSISGRLGMRECLRVTREGMWCGYMGRWLG